MVLNHTRVLTSIVAALSTVIDGESSWTDHCTVQGSSCTALIAAATPGESEQALFVDTMARAPSMCRALAIAEPVPG